MSNYIRIDDFGRTTRPLPPRPQNPFGPKTEDPNTDGPKDLTKQVPRPGGKGILDRMKRVDPDLAKKYKQRSGQ